MILSWDINAWQDYLYWQTIDANVLTRINMLIEECSRTPLEGKGKPKALKENLSGYWSRRIIDEHRLIYRVYNQHIHILQCRFHH